jgi:predicted metal-binding protein
MVSNEDHMKGLCNIAKKMGAADAKPIRSKDIVVRDWVRLKCQFGCDDYGRLLTCPPYTPTPEELRRVLKEYRCAILLKFSGDHYEDNLKRIHDLMVRIEREAFLSGNYAALALSSGPCPYCDECNLEMCEHPDLARPSMEGCGIDVFATVKKAGLDLRVVKNKNEKPTYYGLLLVE